MPPPPYPPYTQGPDHPVTPAQAMAQYLRPWIGVRFLCSGQYVRVYRNRGGDAYMAACPTCLRTIKFRVGEGGVATRFFEVSC